MATPTPIITKPPTRVAATSLDEVRVLTEFTVHIEGIPVVVTGMAHTSQGNWGVIEEFLKQRAQRHCGE